MMIMYNYGPPKLSLMTLVLLFLIINLTNSQNYVVTSYSTIQGDAGYDTYSIISTVPGKSGTVSQNTKEVSIEYITDINPSTGSVKIYQKNPKGNVFTLQQKSLTSESNVTISGKTMSVKVEDYTFGRHNTTYTIVVDDEAVKATDGQNLIGLRSGIWQVISGPGVYNTSGDISAIIRLTVNGTKEYLENNKAGRKNYVEQMSTEIAGALQSGEGRISVPDDRFQYARHVAEDQILLDLLRNELDKKTSNKVIMDEQTGTRISELDSTYGAPETSDLWRRYKWILIGVAVGLVFLSIVWFFAWKKYDKGRNFLAIFFYPLVLIDFILDIVVLEVHGRDLKWFYICCWAFLLVPILFNITIAWKIIDNQKSRETRRWWKTYPSTALGFTFISCIDLEALNFVSSRCAGNDALNPRFTNEGRKQIATSTIIIACIEDLPQLTIYSLYQRYTVVPAIIPILVLSSACIILLFKISSFIYLACIYKPDERFMTTSALTEKDDGNLEEGGAREPLSGGAAPTTETTTGRPTGGVTEYGNVGKSPSPKKEKLIDTSDNDENEAEATTAGLTKTVLLAGSFPEGGGGAAGVISEKQQKKHSISNIGRSEKGKTLSTGGEESAGAMSRKQQEKQSLTHIGGSVREEETTATTTTVIGEGGREEIITATTYITTEETDEESRTYSIIEG